MAKVNANKVNPAMARMAIERATSRNAAYSECVRLSYQSTGRLACGFDNRDLQAWIDMFMPEMFDAKGNKNEQK